MTERKITYLGTITTEPGEALALNVPLDADADKIAAAIERANAERLEAAARETAKLRELFLPKDEQHE